MRENNSLRMLAAVCVCAMGAVALAQSDDPLTLDEALDLAKKNNGTVRSAFLNLEASRANTRSSYAAFLPTVTPSVSRSENRTQFFTGPNKGTSTGSDTTARLTANWTIFDNGSRRNAYNQSLFRRDADEYGASQTLRQVLFSVHSSFYDALRSLETLKVQDRQIARAQEILDQTKFRASDEIGDAPKKDIKQAEADFLNARVSQLTAQNRVDTSQANLKAILGINGGQFVDILGPQVADLKPLEMSLEQAIQMGTKNRPDLKASRSRISAQQINVRQAKLNGGLQYSVDANFSHTVTQDDPFNTASLQFNASIPLYDGHRSKAIISAAKLGLQAQKETLVQSERDAAAEIESAYKEYSQNILRYEAAQAALEASQENYRAAVGAREEGAGTLLEILTAQVSLSTAESNKVEAQFDALISDVRLKLATGQALPGEEN